MDTNVKLKALSEHFQCGICQGYIIDANTITECLHSFCKSCIFHFIESIDRKCPTCNQSLIDTDNCIKSDSSLQRLIYQLIPSLLESELERREAFQSQNRTTNFEKSLLNDESLVSIQLKSSFHKSVEAGSESTKENFSDENLFDNEMEKKKETVPVKYIQCVAQTPVRIISRMLRNKYNISLDYTIYLSYMGHEIGESETLLKVFTSFIKSNSEVLVLHYDLVKSFKTKNAIRDKKKELTSSINGISSLNIKNDEKSSKSALADLTKKLPLSIKTTEAPLDLKNNTKSPNLKSKNEAARSKPQLKANIKDKKQSAATSSLLLQPTLKTISKSNKKQEKSKVRKLEIKVKVPTMSKSSIAKALQVDEEIVVFKPSINSETKETEAPSYKPAQTSSSLLKPAESNIEDAASVYYSDQDYDDDSEEGRLLIDVNNNNNNDEETALGSDESKSTQPMVKNSVNNDSPLDLRVNQK